MAMKYQNSGEPFSVPLLLALVLNGRTIGEEKEALASRMIRAKPFLRTVMEVIVIL
jgi:hypothetical protein